MPLSAVARYEPTTAPLAVNHQGQFPSVTVSFNLTPGVALSDASREIDQLEQSMGMPSSIHGMYSGTLQAFRDSLSTEPMLIVTALMVVYIVLGILYESYIHPITILSTIPSAGVGAVVALMLFHIDMNVIAIIGMILLIGIVKKNAILMIDFALAAERNEGKNSRDAIFQACLLRFRPIVMTTMAALLGALPLAFGRGTGSELRKPLGITIAGGLIFSQILTLYTTPVVYLYMDRFRPGGIASTRGPCERRHRLPIEPGHSQTVVDPVSPERKEVQVGMVIVPSRQRHFVSGGSKKEKIDLFFAVDDGNEKMKHLRAAVIHRRGKAAPQACLAEFTDSFRQTSGYCVPA